MSSLSKHVQQWRPTLTNMHTNMWQLPVEDMCNLDMHGALQHGVTPSAC